MGSEERVAEICEEHNQQFHMFCFEEYKLVCPMCSKYYHKAHQACDLDTLIQTLRTDLEFAFHNVRRLKKHLTEEAKIIDENASCLKKKVRQRCQEERIKPKGEGRVRVNEESDISDVEKKRVKEQKTLGEKKEKIDKVVEEWDTCRDDWRIAYQLMSMIKIADVMVRLRAILLQIKAFRDKASFQLVQFDSTYTVYGVFLNLSVGYLEYHDVSITHSELIPCTSDGLKLTGMTEIVLRDSKGELVKQKIDLSWFEADVAGDGAHGKCVVMRKEQEKKEVSSSVLVSYKLSEAPSSNQFQINIRMRGIHFAQSPVLMKIIQGKFLIRSEQDDLSHRLLYFNRETMTPALGKESAPIRVTDILGLRDVTAEDRTPDVCHEHGQEIKRLCVQDNRLLCQKCSEYSHKGHRAHDFDQAFSSLRINLDSALDRVKQFKKLVREASMIIEENSSHVQPMIKQHFEKLTGGKDIKVHEDQLLVDVETKRVGLHKILGEQKERIDKVDADLDICRDDRRGAYQLKSMTQILKVKNDLGVILPQIKALQELKDQRAFQLIDYDSDHGKLDYDDVCFERSDLIRQAKDGLNGMVEIVLCNTKGLRVDKKVDPCWFEAEIRGEEADGKCDVMRMEGNKEGLENRVLVSYQLSHIPPSNQFQLIVRMRGIHLPQSPTVIKIGSVIIQGKFLRSFGVSGSGDGQFQED